MHTFLTTQGHGGLPGWVISSMPGPPPRQHKHERWYTPGTHSFIPTSRIWNDDYGGQKIFGDRVVLKFSDICLTGEEKPPKKPHPGNLSLPGIEPGPPAWQARMLPPVPQRWTNIKIIHAIIFTFVVNPNLLYLICVNFKVLYTILKCLCLHYISNFFFYRRMLRELQLYNSFVHLPWEQYSHTHNNRQICQRSFWRPYSPWLQGS